VAQKDAVYEPVVLKAGYGWTLTAITSAVRMQETMDRIKAQMGGELPAEIRQRLSAQSSEMTANAEKQVVTSVVQKIAYAVLQSMLGENLQYRSSRVEDVGKSPLPDWLDIAIAAHASNNKSTLTYLQQNIEQTFPLEDVLSMSRPFVASSSEQSGGGRNGGGDGGGRMGGGGGDQGMPRMPGGAPGGFPGGGQGMPPGMSQGMPQGMPPGMSQGMPGSGNTGRGQGGFPGGGGSRGGMQRALPKDEQDRMLFDGQSSAFFNYLFEKVGIEKIRELVKQAREGKESRDFVMNPDVLGSDFEKIETDWTAWVKSQKP
jgi:suppressor of tumorigenicity protein 13